MRKWTASAPSNIALIKYMGKTNSAENRPTNTSLSYTLKHLKSVVEIELSPGLAEDQWEPLISYEGRSFSRFEMSERGRGKFLSHLKRLKNQFSVTENFIVRSANDFPSDCGLASSASSFAALTMAALSALSELSGKLQPSREQAAALSRLGSGSSCRSFFSPWSKWNDSGASEVSELGGLELIHQVIVVDQEVKAVSSSEAHLRVSSSLLFQGRPERAEQRARQLIEALTSENWRDAFEITWSEFWDMHALFETSVPSFGYMTAGSLEVLRWLRKETWVREGVGPLITMDAGANIHCLYMSDAIGRRMAEATQAHFKNNYWVISSEGFK